MIVDSLDEHHQRKPQWVMVQQMLQARTSKNQCETVKDAAEAVESRMKDLQANRDEESKPQMVFERCQEQEGEVSRRSRQLKRHESTMCPNGAVSSGAANRQQAAVTASRLTERNRSISSEKPPRSYAATPPHFSTGDAGAEELSRRLKKALLQFQGVLEHSSCNKSIRYEICQGGTVEPKAEWTKKTSCNHRVNQMATARSR